MYCDIIDDLLLHYKTHSELLNTLDQILTRLEHNISINIAKCFFGYNKVAYLGLRLTPEAIIPGKDNLIRTQLENMWKS